MHPRKGRCPARFSIPTLMEMFTVKSDQSNMERVQVSPAMFILPFVTTPHGQFRLANPTAFRPGLAHIIEYHPLDQWARIVESKTTEGNDRS